MDNQTNYEKWIEELCNGIVAVYNEKNILELTFGQAQKWINMTMKYIYLFNIIAKTKDCNQIFGRFDFNNKDKWPEEINMIDRIVGEHKKNFYVPIDNYILGRLYELGKNEFNLYKEGDTYKICDGDKKFTWSKISEWKVYSAFNTKIKEYIGGKGKLPLEWEHEEWLKGSFFNM